MTTRSLYVVSCNGAACAAQLQSGRIDAVGARRAAAAAGWTSLVVPASREQRSPAARTRDLCPGCSAREGR